VLVVLDYGSLTVIHPTVAAGALTATTAQLFMLKLVVFGGKLVRISTHLSFPGAAQLQRVLRVRLRLVLDYIAIQSLKSEHLHRHGGPDVLIAAAAKFHVFSRLVIR